MSGAVSNVSNIALGQCYVAASNWSTTHVALARALFALTAIALSFAFCELLQALQLTQ